MLASCVLHGWPDCSIKLCASYTLLHLQPRERFNPMSLLGNPMVLMMCFTGFIVVVFPKLIANMGERCAAEDSDASCISHCHSHPIATLAAPQTPKS